MIHYNEMLYENKLPVNLHTSFRDIVLLSTSHEFDCKYNFNTNFKREGDSLLKLVKILI